MRTQALLMAFAASLSVSVSFTTQISTADNGASPTGEKPSAEKPASEKAASEQPSTEKSAPAATAPPATTTTTAPAPPTTTTAPEGTSDPAATTESTTPVTVAPAAAKPQSPADRPAPKGQDAVVKLYTAKKFPEAAKGFQKFIADGTADVSTHAYLAYCLYNMKQYSNALKQFDWVSKYGTKTITLQRSAETSARSLRSQMSGVCPANCLKANDPRWRRYPDLDQSVRWIKFPKGSRSWSAISEHHLGMLLYFNAQGEARADEMCPTCGGTGTIKPLKNGDPLPH